MPGFLPFSRASFMLDLVAVAMFAVLPVMLWSIHLVKKKRNYALHRTIQLSLGAVLLIVLIIFEIDVRLHGWRQYAEASPYYKTLVTPVLYVHLLIAISTTVLWIYTIVGALRHFKPPVQPNSYSPHHKRVAKAAALGMCLTAATGWTFFWLAFVA